MSYQQFFTEVEAVSQVLGEYVKEQEPASFFSIPTDEQFTAVWQAIELLNRSCQVLLPLISLDVGKSFLNLPESEVKEEPKKFSDKKSHLYGPDGKPLL